MKNWILKKKLTLIVMIIGTVAGFLYWNFIGCTNGSCGITANWYTSMVYGSLMGWFLGDFAQDKFNPSKNSKKEANEN